MFNPLPIKHHQKRESEHQSKTQVTSKTGTLNLQALEHPTKDYKRNYLLSCIKNDFRITVNNYKSATIDEVAPKVQSQIKEELANGQYTIVKNKP